jgi:mRNA-degrading endonuclease YafQ of YafQ-DinJ toxin-antitoxin module
MFTLAWTAYFIRSAEKFVKRYPDLKKKLADILRALEENPFDGSLHYHQLSGKLKNIQAVSLTDKYHIIVLKIMITDKEVILLDIGSHEKVYRK